MSAWFVNVGTAITGIWAWFTTVLGNIETSMETSIILALVGGLVGIYTGFLLVRKVVAVFKSFLAGR